MASPPRAQTCSLFPRCFCVSVGEPARCEWLCLFHTEAMPLVKSRTGVPAGFLQPDRLNPRRWKSLPVLPDRQQRYDLRDTFVRRDKGRKSGDSAASIMTGQTVVR